MTPGARFSPDGQFVATACFDGLLRIWSVESRALVAQYDRGIPDDNVRLSFCYSPDGSTLATVTNEGIALLDAQTLRKKQIVEVGDDQLPGLQNSDTTMAYSPDGRWMAVGGGRILVWDTESWDSFSLPVDPYGRIAFSPDSRSLLACHENGVIDAWDLETQERSTLVRDSDMRWFVTKMYPSSDRLAGASDEGFVVVWDIDAQKPIWKERAHRSPVWALAMSHDGERFASGGYDQEIHLWDAETQQKLMTLRGHNNEVWSLEFSPDDRYLLTSSKDGTVKLWNAQTKPQSHCWFLDAGEVPVGFPRNGRGLLSVTADGALRHWDGAKVVKSLSPAPPLRPPVTVYAPESECLYVLDNDSSVQVCDAQTLDVRRSFTLNGSCSRVLDVSPDARYLAGRGSEHTELGVWDARSGECILRLEGGVAWSASNDLAVFSPDSRLLAIGTTQREVKLWDVQERNFVRTLATHPWHVFAISFSSDGRRLASSSWKGDVRVVDLETGREVVPSLYGHGGTGVDAHSFSPGGATLVSSGGDNVRFWNLPTGRETLVFNHASNQGTRIPFLSPNGALVVWRDTHNGRVRVESIPTMAEIDAAYASQLQSRSP
ncbi:WD40 repeat domain-containing protein [Aeoliella sp. ICT_H6.2]|uniref:WD40 repeat domain-containing protein n=2 Tax=Aeoliella straminimaris TaxID=2954799 RepID=A0A9X2JF40_9BACT|nr:WD40 repeat domain-containing protein [Aeoliella straminimaris]MCO6042882.1 WD40 repeat domain-containing protein [Aeoliella straminimaris]